MHVKSNGLAIHHSFAFRAGCALIVAGVLAHLPMFAIAAPMHYRLAGMPMDRAMLIGMALIPLGVLLAACGLMPRLEQMRQTLHGGGTHLHFHVADTVPLNREHWKLVTVLVIALAIDVMRSAALGFVMPGMKG